ncbi:MAG TPA: endonuclease MutS2 [bacterium]|nr:endonuclease MutS2 [bacterium]HMW32852.1 endonuclease MutS2 [bacterium]HMW35013.1 endonuclease MutS2 [bacterium]HMZ04041.1 endonuclease MutS2 [bacterium]HNB08118.1 endonuclease MutS2 [bacterium]
MTTHFDIQPLEFDKLKELIRQCVLTPMADACVQAMKPMTDADLIEKRLDMLVEMADLLRYDDTFPIDTLTDIRQLLDRIHSHGTFLPSSDLLLVARFVETTRKIKNYVRHRHEKYPLLSRDTDTLHDLRTIEDAIQHAIDDHGNIKDHASPKLRQLRRDIDNKSHSLRKKLESLARQFTDAGYSQEAIVTMRDGRMVIPVKDEYKNTVRGFVHDTSASGQTVFIEPAEGLELNNEMRRLLIDEQREVERILIEIADTIRADRPALYENIDIATMIEFLFAKARFCNTLQGIKPKLNTSGYIQIKKGFHPLLLHKENQKMPDQRRPVIPLDIEIGKNFRTLIISGPNAGGKTVALKTVGLFVLMTQCGLLIPCGFDSELSLFTRLFADIGDDQSIENDLSTFSSHMQHLSEMASQLDDQTLILIDEMGSGTDPKEGASLAIALLEYFNNHRAVSIVTTHHGELKAFAHNTPGVENGSMEFDQATLEPTYVFRPGIPGSSYAMEISRRIGLHPDIIERAKSLSGTEALRLETLIHDLQSRVKKYETDLADINREKTGLEGMVKFYNDRSKELKQKERALKQTILEEKQRVLAEANKKIEATILEIKKAEASKEAIKSAKTSIQNERLATDQALADEKKLTEFVSEPLHVKKGDRVYIRHMDIEGTVIESPENGGQALIAVGAIRLKIDPRQLSPAQNAGEKNSSPARQTIQWDTDDIGQELDLRGLTAEEALYEVDKYLTDAGILGFREVTLLHGKGSGILRNRINEFLKRDRRIDSYRLGQYGEGDTGVTVVVLKND